LGDFKKMLYLKQLILKFPTGIKNCQNHYTAHTIVLVDRR